MKKIPIGVENFKEIINNNCYYVDKTKFIEEILNDGSKIKLFTRPRRFGKTLNMSTIKHFFDIKNNEKNRKLFSNLDIEKSIYKRTRTISSYIYLYERNKRYNLGRSKIFSKNINFKFIFRIQISS